MAEASQAVSGQSRPSWLEMERALKRFESDWQQGSRPTINDYLPADSTYRSAILVELVATELELRLKQGEPARIEEYLTRYPELHSERGVVLELISTEFDLRRRHEPGLTPAEYLHRFPQFGAELSARLSDPPSPPSPSPATVHDRLTGRRQPAVPTDHAPEQTVAYALPDEKEDRPAIPGYEIRGLLGKGGMGVVYLARQLRPDRLVALKMIRAGGSAELEELERFRREAEAVARLNHPNIVHIYEVGKFNGLPFFSLEFVPGGSLAHRPGGDLLPVRQTARLIETVARAIHVMHRQGIVHRDLKPANVLLTSDGSPKITDFGLAKRLDAETGRTRAGMPLGTPSYMAPEQAAGNVEEIGPATDVYGLGATLYDLLTGRPPFQGADPVVTIRQVLDDEPLPPRRLNPALARDLETICLKCLHKQPVRRYGSAEALADDLRRFQAGEPIRARPVGLVERLGRWCRRKPLVAALAAALLLAFPGGFAGVTWQWQRAEAAKNLAEQREEAERRYAYLWHIGRARQEWDNGDIDRMRSVLNRLRPRPDQEDLRGFDWYHLWHLGNNGPRTLSGHTDLVTCVAFSRDGTTLATGSKDKTVKLWDPITAQVRLTLSGKTYGITALAFAPDGEALAAASLDGVVKLWDVRTGKERATLRHCAATQGVLSVAIAPDGATLASGGVDGVVKLWDLRTGQPRASLAGHAGNVFSLAFDADGKWLAAGTHAKTVQLWDLATQQVVRTWKGHEDAIASVAFAPRGNVLAAAAGRIVKLWQADTGNELPSLEGHRGEVRCVAFAPDGESLATASADATVKVWRGGREVFARRGHSGEVHGVAFAPDGKTLASTSADKTAKVWDATGNQERAVLGKHASPVFAVAFASDGRVVVSGDLERPDKKVLRGEVKLWDPAARKELGLFEQRDVVVICLALSADGKALVTGGSDGVVRVWDVAGRKQLAALEGHRAAVTCLALAPDGKVLATGSADGTVRRWDLASRQELAPLARHHWGGVLCLAYSPDGRRLLSGGFDGTIQLWDAESGQELLSLAGHAGGVPAVGFAPDGKTLASGGHDGTVRLWDAATGRERATLRGHGTEVHSVAFAPEGRTLASAGRDVRLWDVATGEERAVLRGNPHHILCVAFAPDGKRLAGGCVDGTILQWQAATDQEAETTRTD